MAIPTLTPVSQTSTNILPATGSTANVTSTAVPFGMYLNSTDFISGAATQVAYTYKKLGGDLLEVELSEEQVYTAFEEATLEYSYLVNIHQAKNSLGDALGNSTSSFDHLGEYKAGALSSSLSGGNVALKYTKFDYGYTRRFGDAASAEATVGGTQPFYSASFTLVDDTQDYDLITAVSESVASGNLPSTVDYDNKRLLIRRVYYISPRAMWRFYGYYGGLGATGNLSTYGQFADDSTFQLVPVWQNKAQAAGYEDAIKTRTSHYSYEIRDNKIRIFPIPPSLLNNKKMWFEFTVDSDSWDSDSTRPDGTDGVNNLNTIPYANIPYENINSIGKQWIRRFALALSKEMLGQIRGKFSTIPIPGDSVTLNHSELLSQAASEQEKLREELKTILDEMTYAKLIESDASMTDNAQKVLTSVPNYIFVG
tara:strand:+ start:1348 stop:2622 length:1275 start_codon:yes stop_codon:yes gene_type:complete